MRYRKDNPHIESMDSEFYCLESFQTGSDAILTIFNFDSQLPRLHAGFYIFVQAKKMIELLV